MMGKLSSEDDAAVRRVFESNRTAMVQFLADLPKMTGDVDTLARAYLKDYRRGYGDGVEVVCERG